MSTASLVYLAITAVTVGFTLCAACVDFIGRRPTKWLWTTLCLTSFGAVVAFISDKAT